MLAYLKTIAGVAHAACIERILTLIYTQTLDPFFVPNFTPFIIKKLTLKKILL